MPALGGSEPEEQPAWPGFQGFPGWGKITHLTSEGVQHVVP